MLIEVMKHMVQGTLGITRIMGELVETGEPALFLEAKGIAKKMAEALGMPEAQLSVTRVTHENLSQALRTYSVSMSRLAKACEAWDHMEDFPYRQTFEEEVRNILSL